MPSSTASGVRRNRKIKEKYSRILAVLGEEGLNRIRKSSVLVAGAGGLGSTVIAYLAGVGVGKLGIADGDVVEVHNLDRQVVTFGNLGREDIEVVREFYVVVSCVDSFASRFVLNELCVKAKKPMVHGAIAGFEGELMVFLPGGPCYRCVYPGNYEEREFPVVPPVAGIVGSLQAVETIKLICGDEVMTDLLRMDFRYMEFLRVKVAKRDGCPVCSGLR